MIFLKNKLFKETFWGFAAKGIAFFGFFLLNVYLARTLGIKKFGVWSFFFSIFTTILLLSYFGVNASVKNYIARYNKTSKLNSVLKSAIKLRLIFSLVFGLLLLLIRKPLAILINKPEFTSMFLFSSLLIVSSGLVEFLKDIFIGLHRIKYCFIINLLEYGLKLLLILFLITSFSELVRIIILFTIVTFATSIVGFYLLYKKFCSKKKLRKNEETFAKKILKYSFPLFLISIGQVILTEVDTVMIGLLKNDYQVGLYSVAKQIIVKLPHISLAIAMGTMPVFAKLNKTNKKSLKKLFYRLLKTNTLLFGLIVFVILIFSNFFIRLFFGAEFKDSALILRLLAPYLLLNSYSMFLSSFLDYQRLAEKRAINLSTTIILNLILNFILIPRYGAIGAAIATSISYIPYSALNWFEVRKILNNT